MQKSLLFLIILTGPFCLSAREIFHPDRENPHWLRYCAISPDGSTIAFTHKGQIYTVPSSGGKARRLTSDSSYAFMPVWSHDGRKIAFAGDRYGNFDVFVVAAKGGEPKRLTAHSADEYPYDFSADDKDLLFGAVRLDDPANRQFPSDALQELYTVPTSGGRVVQLLTTPAEDVHTSPSGRYLIYHDRKGRENPWRKHQTSSIARDIWLYDTQTGQHKKITSYEGEDRSPVFAGSDTAIFYLSEESGSFNVFASSVRQSFPRQLTFFKNNPVRFLSVSRGQTLCFGYDGDVYIKKTNTAPSKVRITIEEPDTKDEALIPIGEVKEMAAAPNGKEIAFVFHGDIFLGNTGNTKNTFVRSLTQTPGEEAGPNWSPDSRLLIFAAERDNHWEIVGIRPDSDNEESVLIGNEQENYQPLFSPDGKEIAYIENRNTLKIFNLSSRESRTILASDKLYSRRDNDQVFQWSPDGKWLLLQFNEQGAGNDEIGIVRTDGKGKLINLTNSGFNDSHPKWAMNGKAILWLSDRSGLRSYAGSGTRQNDVFALFLTPESRNDLRKQDNSVKTTTLPIDGLPGITRARLSSSSTRLTDFLLSPDCQSLYTLSGSAKGYDLWQTDLHTHQSKLLLPLAADEAAMDWDSAGKYIFLFADGAISRVNPETAEGQSVATVERRIISTAGTMIQHPAAERKDMFDHVWRRINETFYNPDRQGVDWAFYKTTYEKFLPDIDNNYDFSELLNEMLGELNTSHTGATYHAQRKGNDVTGSLGAFYSNSYRDSGLQIEAILPDGPLDDASLNIIPGSVITAIDGLSISADRDAAEFFNRKAGKPTNITLRDRPGAALRQITVRPITPDEESDLLYQRWVRRNERETDSLSHGQLGYVHLYRMNDAAYRNVYELALGRYAGRKGLVVDTRFNRGGDLAPELTMFLSGARIRDNVAGSFLVNSEPSFRWNHPTIVLAGESNYSDGSCFVYDYQYLHMGKFVGMPVPGSCTFQTGQSMTDPSLSWTCPTLGVKDRQKKILENKQAEPDIRIRNDFEKVGAGQDQQLETAVQVLLKDLQ